jgi:Asp-tRNA(Asn)/Glu-tRNA(Gln) amidotransferase C subunit
VLHADNKEVIGRQTMREDNKRKTGTEVDEWCLNVPEKEDREFEEKRMGICHEWNQGQTKGS